MKLFSKTKEPHKTVYKIFIIEIFKKKMQDNVKRYYIFGIHIFKKKFTTKGSLKTIQDLGYFDKEYYYFQRPDVKEAGVDALEHYLTQGWKEGTIPSLYFDNNAYLEAYPEVKMNPLLHYLLYGKQLGNKVYGVLNITYDVAKEQFKYIVRQTKCLFFDVISKVKIKQPLISILIPAYNHEKYVKEAILSAVNQSYKNIEIIIVDSSSSDSTWQKICELKEVCEKRFKRVVLKRIKKVISFAEVLNYLVSLAEGEYIFFLHSDDVCKETCLEEEVNFLRYNHKYGAVVADNEIIDHNSVRVFWDKDKNNCYVENGEVSKTFIDFYKKIRTDFNFNSEDFGRYITLLRNNYIPNGYLVRINVFKGRKGFFFRNGFMCDYDLWLHISKKSKIKYIDKVLFSYRWFALNSSHLHKKEIDTVSKNLMDRERSTYSRLISRESGKFFLRKSMRT
ncbi:MAG: glycosyltransferase family 2 protein [Endomicrobium sp.]|jgi:alpha-1,3-rhamnosyltransferase|nr:glycosyltransferase family 2 protein [Endomicrobium sp.]